MILAGFSLIHFIIDTYYILTSSSPLKDAPSWNFRPDRPRKWHTKFWINQVVQNYLKFHSDNINKKNTKGSKIFITFSLAVRLPSKKLGSLHNGLQPPTNQKKTQIKLLNFFSFSGLEFCFSLSKRRIISYIKGGCVRFRVSARVEKEEIEPQNKWSRVFTF